jgi:hypothetical protein
VNEYLSYDILTNSISIDLPEDRLDEFKGEHSLKITLTDSLGTQNEYTIKVILEDLDALLLSFGGITSVQ